MGQIPWDIALKIIEFAAANQVLTVSLVSDGLVALALVVVMKMRR